MVIETSSIKRKLLDPRNKHFQLEFSTLWPIEKVYLPFSEFWRCFLI